MISGQLSKPPLALPTDMSMAENHPDTPDSELRDSSAGAEAGDAHDGLFGTRAVLPRPDPSTSPSERKRPGQTYPGLPAGAQHLLAVQQLASAVSSMMPTGTTGLNQPILIPFNMPGQLGGQQGLVLTMPNANLSNIQGLMAAAASGIITLPLQNLQAPGRLSSPLQHLQHQHRQQKERDVEPARPKNQQDKGPVHPRPQTQQQKKPDATPTRTCHQNQHSTVPGRSGRQNHQQVPDGHQPPSPRGPVRSPKPCLGSSSPPRKQNQPSVQRQPSPPTPNAPRQRNPVGSQAITAAALGHIGSPSAFGNPVSSLQGISGQLVTNAQGQIIGAIPLLPNPSGPCGQPANGSVGLSVQPIVPQLLTNTKGQIIATVIGNQILPVINTQGITLSPVKHDQQLPPAPQRQPGPPSSQASLLHLPHNHAFSPSPMRQASSSSSSSSSPTTCPASGLSVGQLVRDPQVAPGEVDGVSLEEIREFAKAFKVRRLSLGLTQTQVGQALSAAEGPAYSQSAICRHTILRSHFFLPQEAQENTIASSLRAKLNPGLLYPARFEKLDITPKSAQKIKPVLERWMAEAEARQHSGMQNLTEFIGSEPSKKRKRRTSFTPQALEILNMHFEKNTHPSGQEMTEIAEKLNYDREVVRVWFCNKRQALKNTIKRLKQPDIGSGLSVDITDSLMDTAEKLP
ncbi:POU domain, class 6, transcription factor 2-like isoform X1 [Paramormyrops kingsleyae]|nr:POU domain, class 6, transcription factor 2-like isoform X1 [Paramormyrops kingsleyae]